MHVNLLSVELKTNEILNSFNFIDFPNSTGKFFKLDRISKFYWKSDFNTKIIIATKVTKLLQFITILTKLYLLNLVRNKLGRHEWRRVGTAGRIVLFLAFFFNFLFFYFYFGWNHDTMGAVANGISCISLVFTLSLTIF